jgi:hypothetical protein
VPDGEGGFDEALLESENGGKVVVAIKHEKKTFKKEQIQQVFSAKTSANVTLYHDGNLPVIDEKKSIYSC